MEADIITLGGTLFQNTASDSAKSSQGSKKTKDFLTRFLHALRNPSPACHDIFRFLPSCVGTGRVLRVTVSRALHAVRLQQIAVGGTNPLVAIVAAGSHHRPPVDVETLGRTHRQPAIAVWTPCCDPPITIPKTSNNSTTRTTLRWSTEFAPGARGRCRFAMPAPRFADGIAARRIGGDRLIGRAECTVGEFAKSIRRQLSGGLWSAETVEPGHFCPLYWR